ncbi:MAG: hypothetical protein R2763_05035 [Mycobacterium sp.]
MMRVGGGLYFPTQPAAAAGRRQPGRQHDSRGRALLASIPLACAALVVPWLGYRWPTRAQSITTVVLGSLLLAAGCVVCVNPMSGRLISTIFPVTLGYAR